MGMQVFPRVSESPTLTYNRANSVDIKNAIILNIIYLIFVTQKLPYVKY